jgi:hypothetical protein
MDVGSPAYEAQCAVDTRREAMIAAVAQVLMDATFGKGTWARVAHSPEGQSLCLVFERQARDAVAVVEQWSREERPRR